MTSPDPLTGIPPPAATRLAVRVTPAGERALRGGHPWLLDHSIARVTGNGRPGDLAVVFDRQRRFLAVGLYDPTSPIRVRVLAHGEPETIDAAFLAGRLCSAAAQRTPLAATDTTGYRVVHGENDGLPGLVVDRYDTTLVAKLYTPAWVPWLTRVRAALEDLFPSGRLVVRWSRTSSLHPEHLHGLRDATILAGPPLVGPVRFRENGLRYEADVRHGQKTGFFFDQRENRARVAALAAGRRTLDVFAYTGAFSLNAARGGAPEVWSIDAAAPALEAARRNFDLNRDIAAVASCRHIPIGADAFAALSDLAGRRERYGLVVLDPPALAKRASETAAALRAYARLARLAVCLLAPDGVLVMASCSTRVPADDFFATVLRAASGAGRPLHEIERTLHPLDHPVRFAEGAYLKCLFATAV